LSNCINNASCWCIGAQGQSQGFGDRWQLNMVDVDIIDNERLLLQLWCNNALCVMYTFLHNAELHNCT